MKIEYIAPRGPTGLTSLMLEPHCAKRMFELFCDIHNMLEDGPREEGGFVVLSDEHAREIAAEIRELPTMKAWTRPEE